jgi:plastocyanin
MFTELTKRAAHWFLRAGLVGAMVFAAGCDDTADEDGNGTPDAGDGAIEVTIDNETFTPQNITIAVGQTVRWTNQEEDDDHTVTAGPAEAPTPDEFDSGIMQSGDTFEFTFDEAGTFDYHCEVHSEMSGTVTVE